MMTRKLKVFLASVLFSFVCCSLFAVEEYIAVIYKDLDKVFIERSEDGLDSILKKHNGDRNYYLIENYTEKKIRRLVINDDYEFAITAIVVVIENNIDNERAVEMYSSIMDSYEVYKKKEEAIQAVKNQEKARIEQEKESKRQVVDKDYVSSQKAGGGAVYVSGKNAKQTSVTWHGAFGLVDLSNLIEQDSGLNLWNYGINMNYTREVELEKITVGGDAAVSFRFLSLTGGENKVPLLVDFEAVPKIGFPKTFRNFFIRAGFAGLIKGRSNSAKKTAAVMANFYTPVIGIQLEKLKLGSIDFTFNYDYYAGHLYYNDINLAMGAGINFAIPFAEIDRVKLTFNAGLKDKIFVKENGLENRANIVLAIGVENVNK